MQNDNEPAKESISNNALNDEEIIKFAETVLADLDDNAVGKNAELEDDDDDIIDLTEVAQEPQSDENVPGLSADVDVDPSADADMLALEGIAENAEIEDEVVFELEDDIQELSFDDDAVVEVDGADLDGSAGANQDDLEAPADLFGTESEEALSEFTPESGTGETAEFDGEALDKTLTGSANAGSQTAENGAEAPPPATGGHNSDLSATGEDGSKAAGLVDHATGDQMTDIQQEKLELTEADRRLLEEELSLEKQTDTSSETIDSREVSATPPAAGAAAFGYRSPENFDVDFGETAADSEKAEDTSAAAPSHAEEAPWFDAVLDESAPAESSEDHHLSPADEKWPDDAAMSQARTTETESDAASTNAQTGHASAEPPSIAAAGLPFSQPADGDGMMGKAIGPLPETLPQAQIEAAVKKALKELLGEKIETLLCEAVDKAVSKEIDRMKSLILGDIDHER